MSARILPRARRAFAIPLCACALLVGVAFPHALQAWSSAVAAEPARSLAVAKPRVDFDPIPFGAERKQQMANYARRHYGEREWRLEDPAGIVLHFTATSTYGPVFNTFAANAPALGERPGVCAQFVVDKDGTVHQLTRLGVRCRHTIGLNHVSFGVEMVQEDIGAHDSEQAILDRRAQAGAAVRLVAWLRGRYAIDARDVIGHAMANDSRLFEDRTGWRNDHVDWGGRDVREFRERVARVIHSERAG